MKKSLKCIIAAITVAVIVTIALFCHSCTYVNLKKRNRYKITAETDGINLSGELTFDFYGENDEILYFCLYPNALRNEANTVNTTVSDKLEKAYPNGFDSGYIDILSVKCNGKQCDYGFESDGQILAVYTAKKGNKTLNITFSEKLPYSPSRFGYGENTYNYGNWYPVLCPTVNGEIIKNTYTSNGDPFCSETADYFISLTAPKQMRVASTGKIITCNSKEPYCFIWQIEAENVRDFAFCLSDKYNLCSQKTGKTVVYSYYYGDEIYGRKVLEWAVSAVNYFNEIYGEYPYETFSVAQTDFYIGGMEYPNLVYINGDLYSEDRYSELEEITVHETAHQWWYGIVGNDEKSEPWLDEGLTEYSVALYLENTYGIERYGTYIKDCEGYCKTVFNIIERISGDCNRRIACRSDEYSHWLLYNAAVYDASAVMFDAVRGTVGKEALIGGMKKYFEEQSYKIATREDFCKSFSSVTDKEINQMFDAWLDGRVLWN